MLIKKRKLKPFHSTGTVYLHYPTGSSEAFEVAVKKAKLKSVLANSQWAKNFKERQKHESKTN